MTNPFILPDVEADEHSAHLPLPFFVFGTLRPGYGNDRTWQGLAHDLHDDEVTLADHRLVSNGSFPYCIPAEGQTTTGTLIVPFAEKYMQAQHAMDMLEGFPRHYNRKSCAVTTPDGVIMAWYYIPDDWQHYEGLRMVPGNNWRNARDRRDDDEGFSRNGWWSA